MKHPTDYLAAIGRKGGKAKGPRKARSPEFYRELSRKGVEARKRKASVDVEVVTHKRQSD